MNKLFAVLILGLLASAIVFFTVPAESQNRLYDRSWTEAPTYDH